MKLTLSKCIYDDFDEVISILNENNYFQIGEKKVEFKNKLEMLLFFESHEKEQVEWLSEVLNFFNVSDEEYEEYNISHDVMNQYNAIILLKTQKNLYTHSFSQGFRIVEKIIDDEFGLRFAEKAIKSENITLKNVSYIQKNKMKGITNYKKEQGEFPRASESYAFVSGKPDFENFGKSVDCGTGVTFSKSFDINNEEGLYELSELLKDVDEALNLKKNKSILPRRKKISKKDDLTKLLDKEIVNRILRKDNEIGLALDVSKIHLVNNSIDIYSENNYLEIYVTKNVKNTKEVLEPRDSAIVSYINKHNKLITSLDDMKIKVTNFAHEKIETRSFKEWIYCEVEHEGKLYTLDSGFWGYFNDRFSELLQQQLDEVNRVIEYNDDFNISYDSGEGLLAGEGGYIEELSKNSQFIKLHLRNINYNKTYIEIADIYVKEMQELIAIKRGIDTSKCMYSFEQSILSVQMLRNTIEFNVKEELLKYNNRKEYKDKKKYPNIRKRTIDKILDSRISSVLWLHNTRECINMIESESFDFNKIGSILLKLKVVDWYTSILENNFTPKIYMCKDLPKKQKKPT